MDTAAPTDKTEPVAASTQSWARRATSFLSSTPELEQLDSMINDLTANYDSLPPEERQKLKELSELMSLMEGDTPALSKLSRDGAFEITSSEDRMSLCLSVDPPLANGKALDVKAILDWLQNRSITEGIDSEAIREAVGATADGQEVSEAVIVRGQPPKAGQDESCVFLGRRGPDQPLRKICRTDQASPLDMPWTCLAGDQILLRVPATPGIAGYDAHGNELPPPEPAMLHIEAGQNVRAEGNGYFAEIDGVIVNSKGYKIQVRPLMVIGHDITGHCSPVDFHGELHIRGALRDGTDVKAHRDMTIDGAVEGATIESRKGDVIIHRGLVGRGHGVVRAHGNVVVQFAENVTISAGSGITIHGGAINCRLVAGSTIMLDGSMGRIIGGTALAGERIDVGQLGSPGEVPTELCVGLSPEAMIAVAEIDEEIAAITRRRNDATELADRIRRAVGQPEKLPAAELKLYMQLCKTELICRQELRQLGSRREAVLEKGVQDQTGRIDVRGKVFPGVTVRIGNAVHHNRKPVSHCVFEYARKEHKVIVKPRHQRLSRAASRSRRVPPPVMTRDVGES